MKKLLILVLLVVFAFGFGGKARLVRLEVVNKSSVNGYLELTPLETGGVDAPTLYLTIEPHPEAVKSLRVENRQLFTVVRGFYKVDVYACNDPRAAIGGLDLTKNYRFIFMPCVDDLGWEGDKILKYSQITYPPGNQTLYEWGDFTFEW